MAWWGIYMYPRYAGNANSGGLLIKFIFLFPKRKEKKRKKEMVHDIRFYLLFILISPHFFLGMVPLIDKMSH